MFIRTLLFLSLFLSIIISVQAQVDLEKAAQVVANHLGPVKTGKGQYTQQLAASKMPYRMTFTVTYADEKGKAHDEIYHLNVADLEAASITSKPVRDVITITIGTRLSRNFIRFTENGQPGNFTNKLILYAENPGEAKELIEGIRQLAAAGKNYQPTKLPEDYKGLIQFIKGNIGSETIGNTGFEQSLEINEQNPLLITFNQNKEGNSDDKFIVNTADLNVNDLRLEASGKYLQLTVVTRNRDRLVRYLRTGKPADLVTGFDIISTDPDRLRSIEAAFRKLIPLAVKQLETQRPAMQTMAEIQKVVTAGVRSTIEARDNSNQRIEFNCECVLSQSWANRSSQTEDVYRFSLDDLAEHQSKLSTLNGLHILSLSTGSRSLIKVTKNQVPQSYVSNVNIYAYDLETIRFLPQAFSKAIQLCRQARKNPMPVNSTIATLSWLSNQMPSLQQGNSEIKTTLEPVESNNACLLRFSEKTSGRKTSETQYEIPLKALNVGGVETSVNGSSVFVIMYTTGRQRMIKMVRDGKPGDYTNNIRIQFDDVEKARYVADGFRHLIRHCTN
ncbi:hypothetical protein GCM10028807_60580 [Spirosoma daeguense]